MIQDAQVKRATVALPRRNRLAWSVEVYAQVIRGEITEDEADATVRGRDLKVCPEIAQALATIEASR